MSDFLVSECTLHGAYAEHLPECPICERLGLTGRPNSIPLHEGFTSQAKPKQKGNKVRADGYTFDSETEYRRYCTLKTLKAHGLISNLEVHPSFELLAKIPKLQSAISYTADFGYFFEGKYIVEDVKGKYGKSKRNTERGIVGKPIISPESRLRHKLLVALLYIKYGDSFEFKIVTEPTLFEWLAPKDNPP